MLTHFWIFTIYLIQIYSYVHSIKSRTKKSKVWKFFKKDPNNNKISVCIICNTEIYSSGNTSNYWDHLHRYHASELKKSEPEEESPSNSTPSGSDPEGGKVETEKQWYEYYKLIFYF